MRRCSHKKMLIEITVLAHVNRAGHFPDATQITFLSQLPAMTDAWSVYRTSQRIATAVLHLKSFRLAFTAEPSDSRRQ